MTEVLGNVPDNIAAFRVYGKVSRSDYEKVIVPQTERRLQQTGEINFLLLVDTDLENFTFGAWLRDALLGLKHLTKWRRAAILTDNDAANRFTDAFSKAVPGEFKGFRKNELSRAIAWVASSDN